MKTGIFAFSLLLGAATSAWAGRPLATDDAATAETGRCQLESWFERAGPDRALVFAPACGIAAGMELAADLSLLRPRQPTRAAGGLAFKWVPEAGRSETRLGSIDLGIKLGAGFERPAGAGWRGSETVALALASWAPHADWAVHANLGPARQRGGATATLLNLAVSWSPSEHVLLFGESQANDRHSLLGGTVHTAGARWWLVKDKFGLDLTAGREAGAGGPTAWSLGLGWYGLGL